MPEAKNHEKHLVLEFKSCIYCDQSCQARSGTTELQKFLGTTECGEPEEPDISNVVLNCFGARAATNPKWLQVY